MASTDSSEQAAFRSRLGDVLQGVQTLWDVDHPGADEERVVQLLLLVLTLRSNPARLQSLTRLIVASEAEKGDTLRALVEAADDSSEYQLVKYLLGIGANQPPAWIDVSAMVFAIAVKEEAARVASVSPAPDPAPAPAPDPTPAATSHRQSPLALLGRLRGGSPPSQPVNTGPAPSPATHAPAATPPSGPANRLPSHK